MVTVRKTLELAKNKHKGQVDKCEIPYIWHVIRVARRVKRTDEKIVALLHDVVEDTDTSFEEIRKLGVSEEIIDAIDLLTHRKGVVYEEYVRNIAKNALARAVKLADLADNTDPKRMERLPYDVKQRLLKKYETALLILQE
ncbi:MAG TPA: GTP pyrophosphokinase [Clostridia bacterium]